QIELRRMHDAERDPAEAEQQRQPAENQRDRKAGEHEQRQCDEHVAAEIVVEVVVEGAHDEACGLFLTEESAGSCTMPRRASASCRRALGPNRKTRRRSSVASRDENSSPVPMSRKDLMTQRCGMPVSADEPSP